MVARRGGDDRDRDTALVDLAHHADDVHVDLEALVEERTEARAKRAPELLHVAEVTAGTEVRPVGGEGPTHEGLEVLRRPAHASRDEDLRPRDLRERLGVRDGAVTVERRHGGEPHAVVLPSAMP